MSVESVTLVNSNLSKCMTLGKLEYLSSSCIKCRLKLPTLNIIGRIFGRCLCKLQRTVHMLHVIIILFLKNILFSPSYM